MLTLDLSTSLTDEQAVVFIATGLVGGRADPDDSEVLAHRRVHFAEVLSAVLDGSVREAMTVATVLCAQHMALSGGLPRALAARMLDGTNTG